MINNRFANDGGSEDVGVHLDLAQSQAVHSAHRPLSILVDIRSNDIHISRVPSQQQII